MSPTWVLLHAPVTHLCLILCHCTYWKAQWTALTLNDSIQFNSTFVCYIVSATIKIIFTETQPATAARKKKSIFKESRCTPRCRLVRMLSEDHCTQYSALNVSWQVVCKLCGCTWGTRHDTNYSLIIKLSRTSTNKAASALKQTLFLANSGEE